MRKIKLATVHDTEMSFLIPDNVTLSQLNSIHFLLQKELQVLYFFKSETPSLVLGGTRTHNLLILGQTSIIIQTTFMHDTS